MELIDKIGIFRDVFQGREDVVPRRWESNEGNRSGYNPLCRNEWKSGICKKREVSCKDCQNKDFIPMSEELIEDHFRGKHVLGCYPLLPNGTCHFIVADFDDHKDDGFGAVGMSLLEDVKRFVEVCEVHKIYCYVFRSRSGKGYHVYSFFQGTVPAWKARVVYLAMLEEAEILETINDFEKGYLSEGSGFDRLFPSQNNVSDASNGLGSLVALPFQGNAARQGKHTMILDPGTGFTQVYSNEKQWEHLSDLARVTEGQLDVIIKEWDLYERSENVSQFINFSQDIGLIESCKFLGYCKDHPENLPEPLWFAMISNVICIRPGGYSMVHNLSKAYPGYSKAETDVKIHHAIDDTAPHTCKYIIENGFDCKRDCSVKSPAVLLVKSRESKAKGTEIG